MQGGANYRWYVVLGPENLKPGDIIVGYGHHMLYLGKASSYSEICKKGVGFFL